VRINQLVVLIPLAVVAWSTGCRNETAVEPMNDADPAATTRAQAQPHASGELRWYRYVPHSLSDAGVYQWQYPIDQRGTTQEAMVATSAVCSPLGVHVPLAGEPGRRGVALLPANLAAFDNPNLTWVHKSPLPVLVSPQTDGERLAYIDGSLGDDGRRLRIVGADGKLAWDVSVATPASGAFVLTDERVLVQDQPGKFTLFDEGEQVWRTSVGNTERPPLIWRNQVWTATKEPPSLDCVALDDGSRVMTASLVAAPTTAPVAGGDRVIIGTENGVSAYTQHGAASVWHNSGYSVETDLAVSRQWIAFVTADEKLTVLRGEDGKVVCHEIPAATSCAPLIFDNAILFMTDESLMTLPVSSLLADAEQAEPARCADISWLGPPVADMIVFQQHIYVPLEGSGLVRFGDLEE